MSLPLARTITYRREIAGNVQAVWSLLQRLADAQGLSASAVAVDCLVLGLVRKVPQLETHVAGWIEAQRQLLPMQHELERLHRGLCPWPEGVDTPEGKHRYRSQMAHAAAVIEEAGGEVPDADELPPLEKLLAWKEAAAAVLRDRSEEYAARVRIVSQKLGLDPQWVLSIVRSEISAFSTK